MRKYKSKYGKPYIRRLKAGDFKKIMNNEECGGLLRLFCQDVIELAHSIETVFNCRYCVSGLER